MFLRHKTLGGLMNCYRGESFDVREISMETFFLTQMTELFFLEPRKSVKNQATVYMKYFYPNL